MRHWPPACSITGIWQSAISSGTWTSAAFRCGCRWSQPMSSTEQIAGKLRWDERGLITAVVQDAATNQVLMVAWMNADALRLTEQSGEAHFWSRSRGKLWRKGETSGNVMRVLELLVDCDEDSLLLRVDPAGPACHTGATSCFFRALK